MNSKLTPKERGLLKGAIRRVFSRSELRKKVLEASEIEHSDPKRPRVRKWCRCNVCKQPSPKYQTVVDHIDPVIPLHLSFEEMSLDTVVDRMWCEENNLQPICEVCHNIKTKREKEERKQNKRSNKNESSKRTKRFKKAA